jgi:hypothetical protein
VARLLLQLKERYGNDHPVGMGGVFAIKAGMVRAVCVIMASLVASINNV